MQPSIFGPALPQFRADANVFHQQRQERRVSHFAALMDLSRAALGAGFLRQSF